MTHRRGECFQTRIQRLRWSVQLFCRVLNSLNTSSHCLGSFNITLFLACVHQLIGCYTREGPHFKIVGCIHCGGTWFRPFSYLNQKWKKDLTCCLEMNTEMSQILKYMGFFCHAKAKFDSYHCPLKRPTKLLKIFVMTGLLETCKVRLVTFCGPSFPCQWRQVVFCAPAGQHRDYPVEFHWT